jgi:FkbM family methyltransferase
MELEIQDAPSRLPYGQLSAMMNAPAIVLRKINALARLVCWRMLKPTVTLPSGIVVALKSESDWEIANEIFLQGDYDEAIDRALLSHDGVDPIRILDLGANIGLFSLRCLDRYAGAKPQSTLELVAIEGYPSLFVELEERLAPHRGNGVASLVAKQGLVGRRSGKGMIYSSVFNSCTNTVVREGGRTSKNILLGRHAEDSAYLDLDQLIPPAGAIDLIKCDIEGSELDFLRTYEGTLRRTRLLMIEFHPGHCDVGTCRELLEAYGFCKVRTIKTRPTHSLDMYAR